MEPTRGTPNFSKINQILLHTVSRIEIGLEEKKDNIRLLTGFFFAISDSQCYKTRKNTFSEEIKLSFSTNFQVQKSGFQKLI